MFNEERATDMASYFLLKEKDRTMNYTKLIKLMYFSEREYINLYGGSLTKGILTSMKNGPIISEVYDLVKGELVSNEWDKKIVKSGRFTVALRDGITIEDLGRISRASEKVMDEVWDKFKDYTYKDMIKYSHENCPEWTDPKKFIGIYENKGSAPINLYFLLEKLGYTESEVEYLRNR